MQVMLRYSEGERNMAYFPMYINLENKKVIVIGGGKAALRKINSLLYLAQRSRS